MKQLAFALLLIGGVRIASATFDLMLIPDTSTGAGVIRFDPINRVRLGAFGSDSSIPWNSVNLSTTPGKAWLTGAQTMLFDYSTGIASTSTNFPVGNTTSNIAGTRFAESFGANNYFYDANMGDGGGFSASFSEALTSAPIGTNRVAMIGLNEGNINLVVRNNSNGALVTRTLVTAGSFTAGTIGTATVLSDNGTIADVAFSYRTSIGLTIERLSINISNLSSTSTYRTISGYSSTFTAGIMRAHDGYYVVGRDSGGAASRITALSLSGVIYSGYTTTEFMTGSNRWVGANVVAPEPGSLVAVGVGVAWLLRRRKRTA